MLHLTSVNMRLDSMALASCIFAGITQGSVIWLCAWLTYEKVLKEKEGNT